MPWFKGDDKAHGAPPENRAWMACRASLGLHYLASSYAADYMTDGLVDETFVAQKLPDEAERREATDALLEAGLWAARAGGYEIVGWLQRNPSRADTDARRAKRAAAGKAGANARWNGGSNG